MNEYNDRGQRHGYWEKYYSNGEFLYKGHYLDGKVIGYWEFYELNGETMSKEFYL